MRQNTTNSERWDYKGQLDEGVIPVSYTHLDVYKRQFQTQIAQEL